MWKDSDASGGKLCVKVSFTPGESAPYLVPGELALNAADGLLYFVDETGASASVGVASVTIGQVTNLQNELNEKVGSTSIVTIHSMPHADWVALDPKVATTLYLLTDAVTGEPTIAKGDVVLAEKP